VAGVALWRHDWGRSLSEPEVALGPLRGTVLRGLAWNAGYQVFAALLQFAAMLIVVRIIAPEEYGHWVTALGILQLLNAVSVAAFASHALQIAAGQEPDWTLHWHVGNVVQFALFLLCTGVAVALRSETIYAGVGPLLHIASVGILLNTSAQLRIVMLQRRLDFARLRTLTALSSLIATGAIVLGAVGGLGASALVLGGSVIVSIPLTIDLLLVQRWKPIGSWIAWPEWGRYRESLAFGATRVGTGLLASARPALTSFVLPSTVGFGSIGLMNRAESLFAMSVGRVVTLVSDTAYPILPQLVGDDARLTRAVRAYGLLLVTLSLAGLCVFAACGPEISRTLYGERWAAADSLLIPAALVGLAAALNTVASQVLLAEGKLQKVLLVSLLPQLAVMPAFVGVSLSGWDLGRFYWTSAAGLIVAACIGLAAARKRLALGSSAGVLLAPVVASGAGLAAAALAIRSLPPTTPEMRAGIALAAFTLIWIVTLRMAFRPTLDTMLGLAPGGARLRRLFGTA
jgi:O-antigen/teichoic acid export membrane protein